MNIASLDITTLATNAGGFSALIFVVFLIFRGKLIPASTHKEQLADKDQHIARIDREVADWKAVVTTTSTTISVQAQQIHDLMESGRIMAAVMEALPKPKDSND